MGDMKALRITESYKSKLQVLISAHEAAEMILRVDQIIRCAPRYGLFTFLASCPSGSFVFDSRDL